MMLNPGVADSITIGGGPVSTSEVLPTAVSNDKVIIATAGTRVQMPTFSCKAVVIKALPTNSGLIYVGSSTVASTNGFILSASESVSLDIDNTNHIWLDCSVSGDGVTYMANV